MSWTLSWKIKKGVLTRFIIFCKGIYCNAKIIFVLWNFNFCSFCKWRRSKSLWFKFKGIAAKNNSSITRRQSDKSCSQCGFWKNLFIGMVEKTLWYLFQRVRRRFFKSWLLALHNDARQIFFSAFLIKRHGKIFEIGQSKNGRRQRFNKIFLPTLSANSSE